MGELSVGYSRVSLVNILIYEDNREKGVNYESYNS